MTLNPRQIEAFKAVMKLGSITRASEVLGISQPAASRLIKDLEAQIGFPLFRREGNRITPGHEATLIFNEVEAHFRGLNQIQKVIDDIVGDSLGTLRIAGTSTLSAFVLPELSAAFLAERPGTELSITTANSAQILEQVALRQFDIGFVQVTGEYPGLEVIKLPPLSAVCVLPAGHSLCKETVLTPEHFQDETFISLGRTSPLRMRADALFEDRKVMRKMRIDATLATAVCSLVAEGVGIALVDPFAARKFSGDRLVIRSFLPQLPFDVAAVRSSHSIQSENAKRFLASAIQKFRQLKADN